MKRLLLVSIAAMSFCAGGAASAAEAPFGCTAQAAQTCYFRIFYADRGGRVVTLPGGTKTKVVGLTLGKDRFCAAVGKSPVADCAKKAIRADINLN